MKHGDLARDAIGIFGAALIVGGVTLLSLPAGLILAGLMMLAAAWLSARAG